MIFRQTPPNVRRTFGGLAGLRTETGGSARCPPRTGGRVHSKNVHPQKLIVIFHHCSLRKNFCNGRPSAAEILIGSGLGLGLGLWFRLWLMVMVKVRVRVKIRVRVRVP